MVVVRLQNYPASPDTAIRDALGGPDSGAAGRWWTRPGAGLQARQTRVLRAERTQVRTREVWETPWVAAGQFVGRAVTGR